MAKKPGLGITLPVDRGSDGYFRQAFDAKTQIRSNLTSLILTKRGERVMQPTFGCRVHEILFDQMTDSVVSEIKSSIEEAIQIWLPFINILDIKVQKEEDKNQVFLNIAYSLRANVKITDNITLVI